MSKQLDLIEGLAEVPTPLQQEVLKVWNEIAPKGGWAEARFVSKARRAKIAGALEDYGGIAGWKRTLEQAVESDFLTGKTGRGERHATWMPDIDWFLGPQNRVKVIEGKYRNKEAVKPKPIEHKPVDLHADDRARMRNYRPRGFWPASWGPRPEEAGCRIAAPVLAEWREVNQVRPQSVAPVPADPLQRRRDMIASYRSRGLWDRANQMETELARMEGRPPVHQAAPDNAEVGQPRPQASFIKPPNQVSDADWRDADIPW